MPLWKWLAPKIGYGWAIVVAYILITPLIIAVSYALTVWVDDPCKDYVYQLEKEFRKETKEEQGLAFKDKCKKHKVPIIYSTYLLLVALVSLVQVKR